ncbi:DUF4136 domain-containing protein [Algoriphagus sp. AK58]|uniref:DUF4136 domain-containing protein n=1 Tax=Algoriphagus sp. AK58 TaxID=1406877 RepID=UPI00164FCE1F|nr:DUF4136 domain-containing protein [Algoriphagus sp. AK58]MBC6367350.1 DUF4136 domain-containing protein [Algoriphagus sp. AK58]
MKNLFVLFLAVFALASCKVADLVTADGRKKTIDPLTYDQVIKSAELANKKTFKVIEQANATKDIVQLNRMFEKKLVENGFSLAEENPQLLVQSVIASVDFENEVLRHSVSSSPGGYFGSSPSFQPVQKTGQYGKVIFLIQDAKTNEVLWMGTGTGILTANEVLNTKEIKTALDRLIAGLK